MIAGEKNARYHSCGIGVFRIPEDSVIRIGIQSVFVCYNQNDTPRVATASEFCRNNRGWGMKRVLAALCAALLLVVLGGEWVARNRQVLQQMIVERTSRGPAEETPVPTAAPKTPAPTCEPTPVPTVDAEWYRERNATLRQLLRRNGSFANSDEIDAAVERMYIEPNKPMVALTFDDGPVAGVTDKILDLLEKYNVRATFFVVGVRLKKPEAVALVRRAVSLGCEIGNHTWGHKNMTKITVNEMRKAVAGTNDIVFENTGFTIRLLRPPGGSMDGNVSRIAKEQDMAVVKWSQSGNVHEQDPAKIAENVQKQIINGKELEDGDIILLHDTKERMVPAVELIIPQLLKEGYQLVTVSELLNLSKDGFEIGKTYHKQEG